MHTTESTGLFTAIARWVAVLPTAVAAYLSCYFGSKLLNGLAAERIPLSDDTRRFWFELAGCVAAGWGAVAAAGMVAPRGRYLTAAVVYFALTAFMVLPILVRWERFTGFEKLAAVAVVTGGFIGARCVKHWQSHCDRRPNRLN